MKTCEQCQSEYPKRCSEAYWQYQSRRFCSRRCRGLSENPRKPEGEFKARYRKVKTPDGRNLLEHRWVMEQHIGRPLESHEQVHHVNHNRLDNRIENLELVTVAEHAQRHTYLPIEKVCAGCSATFTPHKTKRRRAKYCGVECAKKSRGLKLRTT